MKRSMFILAALSLVMVGCARERPSRRPPIHPNPNMDVQEKFDPQAENAFFPDSSAMRRPPEGTVARGMLHGDSAFFYTGRDDDSVLVSRNPLRPTMAVLTRGQERYDIYCSPCHGRTGTGQGIVVKRGLVPPPSFHDDRLRQIEDGHIFEVISGGLRNMPPYRYQIPPEDRWAIITYFRALQRSQNATVLDVPSEVREKL